MEQKILIFKNYGILVCRFIGIFTKDLSENLYKECKKLLDIYINI